MKNITLLYGIIFSFFITASAHSNEESADCLQPTPPTIPDGNLASKDELLAAKKSLTYFQKELITFRECLVKNSKAMESSTQENKDEEQTEEEKKVMLKAYNDSIDYEERIAEQFNLAVRAYKARQPSGKKDKK